MNAPNEESESNPAARPGKSHWHCYMADALNQALCPKTMRAGADASDMPKGGYPQAPNMRIPKTSQN